MTHSGSQLPLGKIHEGMPRYLPSLQALRAIAATLVVFFHATEFSVANFGEPFFRDFFAFGYVGVDLFFVLSGFVIFHVHRTDIGRPERFASYGMKRLIRIYPIYLALVAILLPIIFFLPKSFPAFQWDPLKIAASLALIPTENFAIIVPAWTLSHELLFYIFFGGAILLGYRVALVSALVWTLAIVAFQLVRIAGVNAFDEIYLLRFLLKAGNLEFFVGIAAVIAVLKFRFNGILTLCLSVPFLLTSFWLAWTHATPIVFLLVFALGAFLLMSGCAVLDGKSAIRWPRGLLELGDASYSIYLVHWLAILALTSLVAYLRLDIAAAPWTYLAAHAVFALTTSIVVYLAFERPVTRALRHANAPGAPADAPPRAV